MNTKIREAISQAFKNEPFAKTLNMRLMQLEDRHSVVEMVYTPAKMDNIFARVHGGAIFGLIDGAFETANQTDGTISVALNVNVTYIDSPKPGTLLRAEARQISKTRKTACFDIKVTDEHGNLIATCQALGYRTNKPLPFI